MAIHRSDCSNFRHMAQRAPERVIAVDVGRPRGRAARTAGLYPVDVLVEAADRQGLLRDITEVFAKEKMNVTGVHTQSVKGRDRRHRVDDVHRRSRPTPRGSARCWRR